ncbi:ABC transporter substrate-binding protein [Deinococcus pimensis]|uniref:ABC transporter substrate-binding protein n=1 Tax=Deinococcus pimensis TaxID=309888 RepID=UPI00047FFDEE|nr:extracellular solute-binding protein [Deinococcus pimensis]
MKRVLTLSSLLLVCAASAAPGAWRGTITMYVQEYTPNWPGVKKESQLKVFQSIADEYQKKYPGMKIRFSTVPVPDNDTNIRVKAAAGELFDIYWAQAASLNSTLPKNVALDLSKAFDQPNPYIPGNKAWKDVMSPSVLAESRAPNGAVYVLSGDEVAYTIFYNKDLFKKAGLTKAPTSFSELVADSKKLKAAGIAPFHAVPAYPWWSTYFLSDLYSRDYAKLAGFDGQPGFSALDEVVAIHKGVLSPKDDRFMSWWPKFKELTDLWPRDYLTLDVGKNYDAFNQDFVGGKSAMAFEGSYSARTLKDLGAKFEVGAFNFPKLTKNESPLATGANVANAFGGTGSFQFAISTPLANKTMREKGKQEAVLDWMRFFGTPRNLQRLTAENGSYAPTWKGTTPKLALDFDSSAIKAQIGRPRRAVNVGNAAPNLGWVDMQRIFGLYLSGNLTLDAAKKQVQTLLDRAAADYARKNRVDLAKYD